MQDIVCSGWGTDLLSLETRDQFFVGAHRQSIALNCTVQAHVSKQQQEVLFLRSVGGQRELRRSHRPCSVEKRLGLLCYSRRSKHESPVTGAVYVELDWAGRSVAAKLHPDYAGTGPRRTAPEEEARGRLRHE